MAVFFYYGGHTYQIVNTGKTWADASSYAQSQGGHLATISSQGENNFVLQAAYSQSNPSTMPTAPDGGGAYYVWLGASDLATEGLWQWIDGTSVSAGYSNWGSGSGTTEPDNYLNQDGLALGLTGWPFDPSAPYSGAIGDAGQWNDINASNAIYSVIEWDSSRMGSSSDDSLLGSEGSDTLNGGAGADVLLGGLGSDKLIGGPGSDKLIGGLGSDTIVIGAVVGISTDSSYVVVTGLNNDKGQDKLSSFSLTEDKIWVVGDNVSSFVHGTDTTIGAGTGTEVAGDRASFSATTGLIELNQTTDNNWADLGDMAITFVTPSTPLTEANFEVRLQYSLRGTIDANVLTGGSLSDLLYGGAGNDTLAGKGGSDTLYGDDDNDLLRGGGGNDILYGGAGQDSFRFDSIPNGTTNVDRIMDFAVVDDTIELENSIFTKLGITSTGPINAAYFKANTTGLAADSNDYLIYETDTGKLFYDADGNGAGASVKIAVLGINLELTNADFVLV